MGKRVFTNLPNHYQCCIECTMQMRGIYSYDVRDRCEPCGGKAKKDYSREAREREQQHTERKR